MRIASGVLVALALGCGSSQPSRSGPDAVPLTAKDWKSLPADQKYSPETLERLKAGDPSLETAEGWDDFQKKVIIPARKKDFPNGPKK